MLKQIKELRQHYYVDEQGLCQGDFCSWHRNGMPKAYRQYLDNKLHGECIEWFSTGQKSLQIMYRNGFHSGESKFWNSNGTVIEHEFCDVLLIRTSEVKALVDDIKNITDEEKLMIKIKLDMDSLSC